MPIIKFDFPTIRADLPTELESKSNLLNYLGTHENELKKIRWYRSQMYRRFPISRKNKKPRYIQAPDDRLKYFQRKIASLLNGLYRVRHPVHGFVSNKSVKSNAEAHLKKKFVLNVDIKDFFPSITENRIVGLLESLGIADDVAKIVGIICCVDGHLPQGAPSSPVFSNMICFRLDKQLMAFAKQTRCIYTRYADDITLSSHQPMSAIFEAQTPSAGKFSTELLHPKLRMIFTNNGFKLNEDKAHYSDRNSRRMVTGIKVNELLNVDRRYVRNLRATLYSIEQLGVQAAQQKYQDQHSGGTSIEAYLRGKISWLGFVRGQSDPVYRAIALRFNGCVQGRKINVAPTWDEIRDRAVWVVEHMPTDDEEITDKNMGQGTAFFLSGGHFITAAHCVDGASNLKVHHPSKPSNKFDVSVIKTCEHRDLALLGYTIPENEYYELEASGSAPKVTDNMEALGYPGFGAGDKLNVRSGTVSSLPTKSAVKLIEVTQQLAQGMSGGPLINSQNEVAGVIHKGGPNEGRNIAIHISELERWIAE